MKKFILSLLFVSAMFLSGCTSTSFEFYNNNSSVENISEKIIRFHVIANSDSESDQALKEEIKDAIIKHMLPKLEESESLEESRSILKENEAQVIDIASQIISSRGYDYNVYIDFSRENFPVKRYGSVVLPQGEYEAYRVIIGEGQGQNWWCVMFPPLCFIDITKGELEQDKTEEVMKEYLTHEEYELIADDNALNQETASESKEEIILDFKIIEVLKNFFGNLL